MKAKLRKAEEDIRQKKKDDDYYRKQADKDTKKIKNLSGELTKLQIAKAKVDKELKVLIVKSNKAKISEGETKSQEVSLDEVEKLRQSLKESGAEAKSAKEQTEKFKKELEAREGDIRSWKAQIDKLAKGLEESDGRTFTATAFASSRLKKIETLEASQTPPNQPKETVRDTSGNSATSQTIIRHCAKSSRRRSDWPLRLPRKLTAEKRLVRNSRVGSAR